VSAADEPRIRLVRYRAGRQDGAARVGLLCADGVADLADAWSASAGDGAPWGDGDALVGALAAGPSIADALRTIVRDPGPAVLPLADVRLIAPVAPRTIVATGWNFPAHVDEAKDKVGGEMAHVPTGFAKLPSAIVGPDDEVVHPPDETRLDYEVELAAVLCRPVYAPDRAEAEEAIGGYTLMNDVSARDRQLAEMRAGLLLAGKNFPTFAPFGPAIVPRWDFDYAGAQLRLRVNGELRQDAAVASASRDLPTLVAYWAGVFPLRAGDVVTIGSPAGVALGGSEQYLDPGDVIEAEEAQIGVLRNRVVAAKA
jgi:2-keto-4-pentenoate hydratase/2-oxohepta-3-ene-1,7-dioic acid hydratase in catechol pathway